LKIAIGIATAGRREVLSAIMEQLAKQTRLPDCLYVCPASPDDLDVSCLETFPAPHEIVNGPRGLTCQRNAILKRAKGADLIVFFDDDFLADPSYLAETERLFLDYPDIVVATGHVLADGILGPGLSIDEGLAALRDALPPPALETLISTYNGYGCNMAAQLSVALQHGIEFDENLPLYGWWEDVDFSRRLSPFGRICHSDKLRGVHLGSKSGRSPGKRLGYSQVANLAYLVSKGSISKWVAFRRIAMNVSANFGRCFFPEPWVDRRGRLVGNLTAFAHLLNGTLSPTNIETLK